MDEKYTYASLLSIIEQLRGDGGCPWDKVQTHTSLLPHLLEESYELVDAIKNEDVCNMKEEIGDVLLQVLLHSQIAKEEGKFTIEDVISTLAEKLVYRHPHVFKGEGAIDTPEKVEEKWDELKKKEKQEESVTDAIERVAKSLPALIRSQKVQNKAAKAGLFFEGYNPIIDQIIDVLEDAKIAIKNGNKREIEEELGDLLFGIAHLATFFNLNAEFALTKSLEKFINRLRYIENSAFAQGKQLSDLSSKDKDKVWAVYKTLE